MGNEFRLFLASSLAMHVSLFKLAAALYDKGLIESDVFSDGGAIDAVRGSLERTGKFESDDLDFIIAMMGESCNTMDTMLSGYGKAKESGQDSPTINPMELFMPWIGEVVDGDGRETD
ncbi:MAG: hypothetical protein F4Y49_02935 [Dehalococcoidia bacterium]|nr:hypothetical protein [Dehalococcoidia bacterium]